MFNVQPIDEEIIYDGRPMITETDLRGKIVFMNRKFLEMSGYEKSELIGKPHSIIRHPDMPKEAFCCMWDTIKKGEMWSGFVKNLRKDGKYYWVKVIVEPVKDESQNIKGYCASRKPVTENDKIFASTLFEELKSGKVKALNMHHQVA